VNGAGATAARGSGASASVAAAIPPTDSMIHHQIACGPWESTSTPTAMLPQTNERLAAPRAKP
jgi:hypothetical protein